MLRNRTQVWLNSLASISDPKSNKSPRIRNPLGFTHFFAWLKWYLKYLIKILENMFITVLAHVGCDQINWVEMYCSLTDHCPIAEGSWAKINLCGNLPDEDLRPEVTVFRFPFGCGIQNDKRERNAFISGFCQQQRAPLVLVDKNGLVMNKLYWYCYNTYFDRRTMIYLTRIRHLK